MNLAQIEKITKAVLYEGYMLYPYRPSAIKNQRRFNFGVIHAKAYGHDNGELCELQTECLAQAAEGATLQIHLRFLRLVDRAVCRISEGVLTPNAACEIEPMSSLEVGGRVYRSWQEVTEEAVSIPVVCLSELSRAPITHSFHLSPESSVETIPAEPGRVVGAIVRTTAAQNGRVQVSAEIPREGLFKLRLGIVNESEYTPRDTAMREDALPSSFLSVHLVLGIEKGEFVSLLDPPAALQPFASACRNFGLWPILIGEPGACDTLLCSPIILYDYPRIAGDSPGDLYDGTEIDEILSLRILTLTEDEKREMRASDERARAILERTESLTPEHWSRLHGALRSLEPLKEKAS
ncbi:MAG TPA: hypothetical protein VMS18_15485 [Candidatus Binatia bacterium]|nr:hypothetical protein [Candidatus Binatia bacterium]